MKNYKNRQTELDRMLGYVFEVDASDLHLVVGKPPMVRIDSDLADIQGEQILDEVRTRELAEVMMNESQLERFNKNRQVDFSYEYKGNARFRVNVYSQKNTVAVAMRNIPFSIRGLGELNLPAHLEQFAKKREGLILFVGPTGHGKSTSLAALIDIINHNRADHIITIEDPIEYMFTPDKALISQREVFLDAPSFPQAIRATLREDVNVVMVGEMRDLESISTTITVAETGHLVFATLHTNDAAQSVDRIIDVFPAHQQNQIRSQLANILVGVVSQRLIPRAGGGRVPAVEILISNNAVRNVIREGRTYEIPNIINTSAGEGMVSLDKSLSQLVAQGVVKMEDAASYANNSEVFNSMLKRF